MALALLFTIALGIASIVSVRGFVDGLTKPLFPLGSRDRLVSVFGGDAQREASPLSKQQYLYVRGRHDLFEWAGVTRVTPRSITADSQTVFVSVAAVTSNVARVFGLPLNDGVVISRRMWQTDFGASVGIIGDQIRINGATARISGIAPGWLAGIYRDRPVDVWLRLPEETLRRLDDNSRNL
jgi:hypothetical protein